MFRPIKFRYRFQNINTKKIVTSCLTIEDVEIQGFTPNPFQGLDWSILSRDEYAGVPDKEGQPIFEGDIINLECWNGGDNIEEPSIRDTFSGVVVYDRTICRFGIQTFLCEEGRIEVGLEDNQFTTIEILGNRWENPELLEDL